MLLASTARLTRRLAATASAGRRLLSSPVASSSEAPASSASSSEPPASSSSLPEEASANVEDAEAAEVPAAQVVAPPRARPVVIPVVPYSGPSSAPSVQHGTEASVSARLFGCDYVLETGRLGAAVDGAVTLRCNESSVLACVLPGDSVRGEAWSMVEYRERASAYGRLPSTITRRDMSGGTDKEIYVGTLMERVIKGLLPAWWSFDSRVRPAV